MSRTHPLTTKLKTLHAAQNGQLRLSVDPSVSDVLFDLALKLEEPTNLPVAVEHVLAAIVLAARHGELDSNTPLSVGDTMLVEALARHIRTIFEMFDGHVGRDDCKQMYLGRKSGAERVSACIESQSRLDVTYPLDRCDDNW